MNGLVEERSNGVMRGRQACAGTQPGLEGPEHFQAMPECEGQREEPAAADAPLVSAQLGWLGPSGPAIPRSIPVTKLIAAMTSKAKWAGGSKQGFIRAPQSAR
jgi:hypothetical protein